MSKVMEDMINLAVERAREETALKMLEIGELSFEDIAKYSGLPIEKIQALAAEQTA